MRTSLFEGMCGFGCSRRARACREREPQRVDWSEDIAGAPCPVSTLSSTAGPHAPYLSRQPRRALRNLSKGACGVGCSGRARVRRGCEPRRVDRPESTSGASPPSFSLQMPRPPPPPFLAEHPIQYMTNFLCYCQVGWCKPFGLPGSTPGVTLCAPHHHHHHHTRCGAFHTESTHTTFIRFHSCCLSIQDSNLRA